MSTRRFYRISIWLPVVVPFIAGLIGRALLTVTGSAGVIGTTIDFVASLVFFGVPYIPFALLATWLIRKMDEYEIRRLMFVMPILMTLVAWILCVVMMFASGRARVWVEVGGFAMTVILLVGYGWVFFTVLLRFLIKPSDAPQRC